MMRSHRAGDVRADDIGESVAICGWVASRRDHGGKVFLDVRDGAGLLQVVVDPQIPGLEVAHRLRNEWVVRVIGTVSPRPEGTVNLVIAHNSTNQEYRIDVRGQIAHPL